MQELTLNISPHIKPHTPLNPEELGHYLAGLIEGDGYFGAKKLEIAFAVKDKHCAYALRRQLGYGHVHAYSRTCNAVRFVISNTAGLERVFHLVNGKLVHNAKVDQLKRHGYSKYGAIKPASKTICLHTHWLAGFIDADGSLGLFIAPSKTHRAKKSVRLEIKISQKDPFLLRLIANLFKVNAIYKAKTKMDYKLKLTGLKRLKTVFGYLDDYKLRTKKYVQYVILRRAYRFMVCKHHLQPDGLRRIQAMKVRLQNVYK